MIHYFLQLSLNCLSYSQISKQLHMLFIFSLFQPVELFIVQKHSTFSSALLVCSLHASLPTFSVNLTLCLRLKSKCKSSFSFIMLTLLISLSSEFIEKLESLPQNSAPYYKSIALSVLIGMTTLRGEHDFILLKPPQAQSSDKICKKDFLINLHPLHAY